jgi:hypothetical protein
MTTHKEPEPDGTNGMSRAGGTEPRPAEAAALARSPALDLPERLSWPAAAAVILTGSLALWVVIGLVIAWLTA